ncbi:TRIM71 [Mytilus coruscus]|uniref:TRIM71 n=1 Tax=Mytilus coruscus TaxID=42192 RepID=A0A6J8EDY8_MYTCO|nr:TRIM71 [Mytilus coruscus]
MFSSFVLLGPTETAYVIYNSRTGYPTEVLMSRQDFYLDIRESIKVLQELDIECSDFALGSKDKIYYGQFRGSELKVLSSDGVTDTVLTPLPMIILGIHINKDSQIILGLREQGHTIASNESIKVLQTLNIKCIDFALGRKDEIYYGQFHGSELKVLSNDGVTKKVLSTSPMIILGMHINKDNEIILGLRVQGCPIKVTDVSSRQIAVFGESNKRKLLIEYDQRGKKLFSYIWRISTDLHNNIYAIDLFENLNGRLVALERSGGVKFIYEGHSGVNSSPTPFNPSGIVVTNTNIIIVSDKDNHSLHACDNWLTNLNRSWSNISIQFVLR